MKPTEPFIDGDIPGQRLQETIADLAYMAGLRRWYGGDSREDVQQYITWAKEFEALRKVDEFGNESYNGKDYMEAVEEFAEERMGINT